MIKFTNRYYYEDGRDKLMDGIGDFIAVVIGVTLFLVVCGFFSSCTTTKVTSDEIEKKDSTYKVKTDTVDKRTVHIEYRDRFVDRYIKDTYILSPLGDTLKEKTYERIYDTNTTILHDSISMLQARIDSLSHIKERDETKVIEKQLSWWQNIQIGTYNYILSALIACIVAIVGYIIYRIKI